MQQQNPTYQIEQAPPDKKYQYQICQVQSASCFKKTKMYVSEPYKYLATHLLLHCGMALHYYATFGYLHISLGIINIILHIFSTLVLIILAFTDPGMIPKIFPTYQKLQFRKIPTNYHRYANILKYYQKQYISPIKSHVLKLKFCNTCLIFRPPRTVHCDQCGICIEKFDHHCPWIGTCVAKRNYKYFLFFIGTLSVLTIKLFIEEIVVTEKYMSWNDGAQTIAKSVINIFLCIYTFPAMGFTVFMFVLHLKFAATNVTTNEFCKQSWQTVSGNPYKKRSWLKNILKTISLQYQGKVDFNQPVYDRNHKLIIQNQSQLQLQQQKQRKIVDEYNNDNINPQNSIEIQETQQNLNNLSQGQNITNSQVNKINEIKNFNTNKHQNYSTKDYQSYGKYNSKEQKGSRRNIQEKGNNKIANVESRQMSNQNNEQNLNPPNYHQYSETINHLPNNQNPLNIKPTQPISQFDINLKISHFHKQNINPQRNSSKAKQVQKSNNKNNKSQESYKQDKGKREPAQKQEIDLYSNQSQNQYSQCQPYKGNLSEKSQKAMEQYAQQQQQRSQQHKLKVMNNGNKTQDNNRNINNNANSKQLEYRQMISQQHPKSLNNQTSHKNYQNQQAVIDNQAYKQNKNMNIERNGELAAGKQKIENSDTVKITNLKPRKKSLKRQPVFF